MANPSGSPALSSRETKQSIINEIIRQLQQGHLNCVVQATLNASATSTTVTAPTCTTGSAIVACPLTADAANDMALMWFQPGNGSFVINHANNARVDRTFAFIIIG